MRIECNGAYMVYSVAWWASSLSCRSHLDVGLTQDAHQGLRIDRWRSHKGTRSPQSPTLKWVAGGVWDEFQKRMPLLWAWSGSIHGMQLFSVYSISGVAMRVIRLATRMVAGMWTNPSLPASCSRNTSSAVPSSVETCTSVRVGHGVGVAPAELHLLPAFVPRHRARGVSEMDWRGPFCHASGASQRGGSIGVIHWGST